MVGFLCAKAVERWRFRRYLSSPLRIDICGSVTDMPETRNARHRLRAGESIRSVARDHGTTPLRLMELNPYVDPTALVAGQELNLPSSKPSLWPFLARLVWGRSRTAHPP
jgi:hypothetical protein